MDAKWKIDGVGLDYAGGAGGSGSPAGVSGTELRRRRHAMFRAQPGAGRRDHAELQARMEELEEVLGVSLSY